MAMAKRHLFQGLIFASFVAGAYRWWARHGLDEQLAEARKIDRRREVTRLIRAGVYPGIPSDADVDDYIG